MIMMNLATRRLKMSKTDIRDRDILDDVVVKNQGRNQQIFQSVQNIPTYFGSTNNSAEKFRLKQTARRKELGKQSLICDIILGTEALNLEGNDGKVVKVEGSLTSTTDIHPKIIKFIKTCVACSMTQCDDYNKVVGFMAKELLEMINHISLPIPLPADNKIQKIIGEELNDYLKKICDETETKWSEMIVQSPKKKTGKDLLLSAARGSDIKS